MQRAANLELIQFNARAQTICYMHCKWVIVCVCVTFIAPLEMFNRVCLSVQLPCIMRYITFDFISHVLFHLFDLRSINWQPNAFTAVVLHTISSFVIFCFSWIKLTQFFLFHSSKQTTENLRVWKKKTNKPTNYWALVLISFVDLRKYFPFNWNLSQIESTIITFHTLLEKRIKCNWCNIYLIPMKVLEIIKMKKKTLRKKSANKKKIEFQLQFYALAANDVKAMWFMIHDT